MAIPGTLDWFKKWYTNYAVGICRRAVAGPLNEPPEEFKYELATCVAWYYEGAKIFLGAYGLSDEEIKEVKEYMDEYMKDVLGENIWNKAKKIASNYKEIFEKA